LKLLHFFSEFIVNTTVTTNTVKNVTVEVKRQQEYITSVG